MFLSRIYYGILYFLVLIIDIIKSTVDMALRTVGINEISPIVMDVETVLRKPIAQTLLVMSINITPGTVVLDMDSINNVVKVAVVVPRDKKAVFNAESYIEKMLE